MAIGKVMKKDIKAGGFSLTSEFVRHLIRLWNTKQLGEELRADRQSFENSKGKLLKSLKDLR